MPVLRRYNDSELPKPEVGLFVTFFALMGLRAFIVLHTWPILLSGFKHSHSAQPNLQSALPYAPQTKHERKFHTPLKKSQDVHPFHFQKDDVIDAASAPSAWLGFGPRLLAPSPTGGNHSGSRQASQVILPLSALPAASRGGGLRPLLSLEPGRSCARCLFPSSPSRWVEGLAVGAGAGLSSAFLAERFAYSQSLFSRSGREILSPWVTSRRPERAASPPPPAHREPSGMASFPGPGPPLLPSLTHAYWLRALLAADTPATGPVRPPSPFLLLPQAYPVAPPWVAQPI